MTDDSEELEIAENVPAAEPRLTIVVVLSVLLGILMTLGAVGTYFHVQESRKLQAEVRVARNELIQKSLSLDEMKSQIEALSMQMNMLKDYSVARSGNAGEKAKTKESAVPPVVDVTASNIPALAGIKGKAALPVVPDPRVAKKNKPEAQNCELVGKSPDEQAATLKRCVSLLDGPSAKTRSR